MSSEKLGGDYKVTESEKPAWKVEREQELARKMKIGKNVIGAALATAIIGLVLSHGMKTSEIMESEERAKNVKKIEVGTVSFHDGVNARKEPFVDTSEPNQLASVGEEGESVTIAYEGEGYYYLNENDANGGWYGFEATKLSDELSEDGYVSVSDAEDLRTDHDGVVWFNEQYVTVNEPVESESTEASENPSIN